ncbi:protein-disulfide reductase DsbD [Aliarcobacter butzleri]|uniref:Protein-disulfide reductase DsbD n=1 Tax=Aliarcobacter butzleri TaxID=28197 RepID=A0AAP4UZH6_9BACT|nr:protein-disulfide reductase DsbD [Aliarcobacter butzleri]MDN5053101.1 protein-disulfide reductase DsbD [Aliarcobacter butzleri]MDN5076196.1 protein-disulfide reductase DsbD [Aliarcobacter butzleri]MDN5117516.1 protein-disulfide reductase DsbD [Aliarcobacter butzleri]MDN5133324.1 protein-disulfide reductase DsbD [Aliarcobacter butzleri]NUW29651.1 protein-disulfide reductase DsbD [Aliarcobacter butzleri]
MKKILLLLILFIYSFSLELGNKVLEPEEAFKVKFIKNEDSLNIKFELGKDIYLYHDKLQINILKPQKIEITKELNIPKPVNYEEFIVHFDDLNLTIPYNLLKSKVDSKEFEIELKFQGCSKAGLCYAPMSQKQILVLNTNIQDEVSTNINETDSIANKLKEKNLLLVLLTFFGFGLLLSLTPCVFPMIPILSSIIVGASKNETMTARRGFFLSLVYVLSMSVAYTIAGVIAGIFGANLQVALQNPYVLVIFALIFVALAFSMFGYFEIRLPQAIQNRVNKTTDGKEKQGILGIAIMGFLSALIVGPCVAPPLAGALVYIGQTGDAILGGLALFVMSLGMGVPLLLIGLGAGKFMPKPGGWMESITKIFGIVMLGVAIWLLDRVLDASIIIYLWALLLLGSAIYLKIYQHILTQLITVVIFILGVILFVGAISGATNPLNPLEKFTSSKMTQISDEKLIFKKVKNIQELELAIKNSNKPVMLDFWASWCVSCKELEEITFQDEQVINKLQEFTLLKADVTENNDEDKALQKKFGVVGPPALIFWDKDKNEIQASRIIGYKNPKDFLEIVNKNFQN